MNTGFKSILHFNQKSLLVAWMAIGFSVLILTQLCSTVWAFANPMPHHWDNAMYLNHALEDMWAFTRGGPTAHQTGIRGVWDSMLNSDPYVPPAYRFVSAPFIFWGMRMLPTLRAISLGLFWVTLYVIYRIGVTVIDGPPGRVAGIVAAMLVGLYSEVGWSIRVYGTEHTLYFATALMLLCLARASREAGASHRTWIGLGIAMGLGILSKISFVLIACPSLAVALVLIFIHRLPGLSIWKLVASAMIALIMAWPFYHLHFQQAWQYGQDMTQFSRHSLHKTGFALIWAWVQLHVKEGLGASAALLLGELIVLSLAAQGIRWFLRCRHLGTDTTPDFKEAEESDVAQEGSGALQHLMPSLKTHRIGAPGLTILMALAMGLPLLIFQLLFATSNNVRHMTPAYLPLTVAVTLAAASAGVLVAWWSWAVLVACAVPAFTQVHRDFVPMTIQADDIWDWDPVYQIAQQHQIRFPWIGHVGNTSQFCDPAITYPWIWRGGWANSIWLWRSEDGDYDPSKVHQRIADRDIVITAPNFHMPPSGSMLADPVEKDNAHNAEFADAMMHEPEWELSGKFSIGTVNKAEIWIFVRKKGH